MGMMANIVCKTAGVAGMSAILYDAYSVGKVQSKRVSEDMEADHYLKIHSSTRTLSTESEVQNAIQKKVADFRMNTPFISTAGNIKGFTKGFFDSLGDNIIPAACASVALAAKGLAAKIGAWGLAAYGLYIVAKEGFGFTKKSPID